MFMLCPKMNDISIGTALANSAVKHIAEQRALRGRFTFLDRGFIGAAVRGTKLIEPDTG